MATQYVIVDKDGIALRDELEVNGLVILNNEETARESIIWLLDDAVRYAYMGLRVEKYDPAKHGV